MISFLKIPTELNLAHNPIAYVLQTNLLTTKYILVKLFIENELGSNTYKEVVTQITVPDAEGKVTVYLDELIKAQLSYDLPNFQTTSAVFCKQTCKRFYISTAELGATEYVGNAVYTAESNRYYALLGAFRRFEYPIRTSLLPNNSQFLTRKSKELTISARQKEWLTILPPQNGTITLNFSVEFQTTTETFSKTLTGVKYQPIHYDISFQAQNYQSLSTEAIKSISVTYLGETRTYYISQDYYLPSCIELYYLNSLGGWDSFLFYGQHTQSIDIDRQEYQKMQLFDYQNIDSTYNVYNLVQRTNGKLFSGHLSDEQFEQYLDIFKSQKVFARLNKTVFIPINIKNKKHEIQNSFEYLKGIELDYEVAYNEIVLMEEDNFTTLVTPPPPPPINIGGGLKFDGLTHYVELPDVFNIAKNNQSFSFAIDFEVISHNADAALLLSKMSFGTNKGMYLQVNTSQIYFMLFNGANTSTRAFPTSVSQGERAIAVVTCSPTTLSLYLKGQSSTYDISGLAQNFENNEPLTLGCLYDNGVLNYFFNGYIYALDIWYRALAPYEVENYLALQGTPTGITATYLFDENTGQTAQDVIGGHTANLVNYTPLQTSLGSNNHWVYDNKQPKV